MPLTPAAATIGIAQSTTTLSMAFVTDGTTNYSTPVITDGAGNYQPAMDAAARKGFVTLTPDAAPDGYLVYRNLDVGTTGGVAKNAAGQLYGYYFANQAANARYLKVYNKATAPTAGDTPVLTLPLPAGGAGHVAWPAGIAFAAGISVRATTALADADTGAPGANDVVLNLFYF